jgi:hypothetical protein
MALMLEQVEQTLQCAYIQNSPLGGRHLSSIKGVILNLYNSGGSVHGIQGETQPRCASEWEAAKGPLATGK